MFASDCFSLPKCVESGNMRFCVVSAHSSRFPSMRSKPSFGRYCSQSGCISPSKCVGSRNMRFCVISAHSLRFTSILSTPSFGCYWSQSGCISPSKCLGVEICGSEWFQRILQGSPQCAQSLYLAATGLSKAVFRLQSVQLCNNLIPSNFPKKKKFFGFPISINQPLMRVSFALKVSVCLRLYFASKVRGKWKYAVLNDLSVFFKVPPRRSKPSFGHDWSQSGYISPSKCVGSGNMRFWVISTYSSRFPPMRSQPSFGHYWSQSGCISLSKCVGSGNTRFWVLSAHSSRFPPCAQNLHLATTWLSQAVFRLQSAWELEICSSEWFQRILQGSSNALKTFIWPLLVSVRLHVAFKVRGKWKYAVLNDFSVFFKVSPNTLTTFIWPLLVSVRLYFASKVRGKWKCAILSDFSASSRSPLIRSKPFERKC